ncbi:MAG: family hydrolase [Mucilaginibacter sp.]|nr:family hydrolase [Mucilaginibacter sp.]
MKKALIFDLDNTIYPVSSIADELFESLFSVVEEYRDLLGNAELQNIKEEFTRRPYQEVADKYNFSKALKQKGLNHLQNITYNKPITTYEGYEEVKTLPHVKFLVTSGFTNLQNSKVKMLGIENDFLEIHIVDPQIASLTKKDIFANILLKYNYSRNEVLVIGDDPESEIKAAKSLGIDTFLFDPLNKYPNEEVSYRSDKLVAIIDCLLQ